VDLFLLQGPPTQGTNFELVQSGPPELGEMVSDLTSIPYRCLSYLCKHQWYVQAYYSVYICRYPFKLHLLPNQLTLFIEELDRIWEGSLDRDLNEHSGIFNHGLGFGILISFYGDSNQAPYLAQAG